MSDTKIKLINSAKIQFPSVSGNESFARGAITAFMMSLDPTVSDITDVKTAVSEAVTNAIIHAYRNKTGIVYIQLKMFSDNRLEIKVKDKGCGIDDIVKAMEPLYSTGGDEQAGIGFAVMESFCDKLRVSSALNKGTTITLTKYLSDKNE